MWIKSSLNAKDLLFAHKNLNLQKALTMLIEKRYKDEDTGSDGVNSLPELELSYSAGVCFFLLKQAKRTIINLKIKK